MTVTNLTPPTVSGIARQGAVLTSTNGTWSYDQTNFYLTYTYQWERCDSGGASCVDIGGATHVQYTLTSADVGSTIRVKVTATQNAVPGPPPPTPYIDQITDFTAVFLPVWTPSGSVSQGVTNPAGLGGGVYEISDGAGSGFRFVSTPQMTAPWQNDKKVCFAQLPVRTQVGAYEEWTFKYRYSSTDNPSFPHSFQGGTIFEFGHHATNSGMHFALDGRNVSGDLGHYLGLGKAPWGTGDFDRITICSYATFISQLNHDYVVFARIRYNPDNTGFVHVTVDGVTIINASRPMRPNTSEIPLSQPGWYSDPGTTKNGVEIRNLTYAYNV